MARGKLVTLGIAPLLVLSVIVATFLLTGSSILGSLGVSSLLIEDVAIERIGLNENEVVVYAVNTGPREVVIAQVLVNDAMWAAEISPSATVSRLGRVTIYIPYHWVEGEPVDVSLITSNGFTFSRSIEAATLSPVPSLSQVWTFVLLGVLVGIVPVFLGLGWLPFLANLKTHWHGFLLSLTAGLLLFLAADALAEAFELSTRVPGPFQGLPLLLLGAVASFFGLEALGERSLMTNTSKHNRKTMLGLAYLIAAGIGLHNLGEGLLIGAAYAIGEVALGTFLILGFTIHNTTEGLAIASPVASKSPTGRHLLWLGLIAGAPTILGAWIGGFTYSDVWAVVFLAIGIGAILQVVYEIVGFMAQGKNAVRVLSERLNLAGILAGFMIMYATALLVS